jgi:hypothetical protein
MSPGKDAVRVFLLAQTRHRLFESLQFSSLMTGPMGRPSILEKRESGLP